MTNYQLFFEAKKDLLLDVSSIKLLLLKVNNFKDFSSLFKHFHEECFDEALFKKYIKKLKEGIPVQYVINEAPFLELDLFVDDSVLIPRPETEQLALLVDSIIKKEYDGHCDVLDIGTGSGCLAIWLKARNKKATVSATDISSKALKVAKLNAKKHGVDINFYQGNLFEPIVEKEEKIDILVSNPPYIEEQSKIDDIVFNNEPHIALLAKPCYKYYEEIVKNCGLFMKNSGFLLFEIGENMETKLSEIVHKYLPKATCVFKKDIYGKTRFLLVGLEI